MAVNIHKWYSGDTPNNLLDVHFDADGGSKTYNVSLVNYDNPGEISFTSECESGITYNWDETKKLLTINAEPNYGTKRECEITKYIGTGDCYPITVTQSSAESCNCTDYSKNTTFIDKIPSNGLSSGTTIGTFSGACYQAPSSGLAVSLQHTDGSIIDTSAYIVNEGGGSYSIKLGEDIEANPNVGQVRNYSASTYIGSVGIRNKCSTTIIPQDEGKIPCSCAGVKYFITHTKKSWPLSGSGEYVIIASGTTGECGKLSGYTQSDIFENREIITEYQPSTNTYIFKAKIVSGDSGSGGLNFYYYSGDTPTSSDACESAGLFFVRGNELTCDYGNNHSISLHRTTDFYTKYGNDDNNYRLGIYVCGENFNSVPGYGFKCVTTPPDIRFFARGDSDCYLYAAHTVTGYSNLNYLFVAKSIRCNNEAADEIYYDYNDKKYYVKIAPNPSSASTRDIDVTYDMYLDVTNGATIKLDISDDKKSVSGLSIEGGAYYCKNFTLTIRQLKNSSPCPCEFITETPASLIEIGYSPVIHYNSDNKRLLVSGSLCNFDGSSSCDSAETQTIGLERYDTCGRIVLSSSSFGGWVYNTGDTVGIYQNMEHNSRSTTLTAKIYGDSEKVCEQETIELIQLPYVKNCDDFQSYMDTLLVDGHGAERTSAFTSGRTSYYYALEIKDNVSWYTIESQIQNGNCDGIMTLTPCTSRGLPTTYTWVKVSYERPQNYKGCMNVELKCDHNTLTYSRTAYFLVKPKIVYSCTNGYIIKLTQLGTSPQEVCEECTAMTASLIADEFSGTSTSTVDVAVITNYKVSSGDCYIVSVSSTHSEITNVILTGTSLTTVQATIDFSRLPTVGQVRNVTIDVKFKSLNGDECNVINLNFYIVKI